MATNFDFSRKSRLWMAGPLAMALGLAGCDGTITLEGPGSLEGTDGCKAALADGDFREAEAAVAAQMGDASALEENYCALLAALQETIDEVGGLISAVAALAPSGQLTVTADQRSLLRSILGGTIDSLTKVRNRAEFLLGKGAVIEIDSLPLAIDLSALVDNIDSVDLNLNGRYDEAEVRVLTAAAAAILGLVDFIFAHSLDVTLTVPELTTAGIAKFLVDNPKLLTLDDTGGNLPSAKDNFILALRALTGDASLSSALEVIEAKYTDGIDHSKDVIRFIDADGNGQVSKGDKIQVKAIEDLAEDIEDLDASDSEITNQIGRAAWAALVELGKDIRTNLEAGAAGSPVAIAPRISNGTDLLIDDVAAYYDATVAEIKNWLAVHPGAFFAANVGLRDVLPAVAAVTVSDPTETQSDRTVTAYDFVFECELGYTAEQWATPSDTGLPADSTWRTLCGREVGSDKVMLLKRITFADAGDATAADADRFLGAAFVTAPSEVTTGGLAALALTAPAELTAPVIVDFVYHSSLEPLTTADVIVDADGITPDLGPDADVDGLLYVMMRDPGLGGVLYLDLAGEGNFDEATQATLNGFIAYFWKTFGGNIQGLVEDEVGDL